MNQDNQKTIALYYDDQHAPQVAARREESVAADILKEARKHEIPIQEDEELVDLLSQVKLNEQIPPKLYLAVAQIITFLYYINDMNLNDNSEEEE